MTLYEALTVLASLLAVVVALLSLHRTQALTKKQLELEAANAELSKRQIELMDQEARARSIAQLDLQFVERGAAHVLRLTNIGGAEARDIWLSYHGRGGLFIGDDLAKMIPIKTLRPSKSVDFLAAPEDSSYRFEVHWKNPDGSIGQDDVHVHV